MPNDFAVVPAARAAGGISPVAVGGISKAVGSEAVVAVAKTVPAPSPNQHYDPSLGLLVVQFVDVKGNVTQSIPNERQLKAYRTGGAP